MNDGENLDHARGWRIEAPPPEHVNAWERQQWERRHRGHAWPFALLILSIAGFSLAVLVGFVLGIVYMSAWSLSAAERRFFDALAFVTVASWIGIAASLILIAVVYRRAWKLAVAAWIGTAVWAALTALIVSGLRQWL
jgi:hypothetical protein